MILRILIITIKITANMKKVIILLFCVGTLNVSAQAPVKKDTVYIGDSVSFVKIQEGKKYFSIYKGKKIRAAKKDSGKRSFIIYNVNEDGERRISKIYYAN